SISELAQRLQVTVAMLWSGVAGADLFAPDATTGELRGVGDAPGGTGLLAAVSAPHGGDEAIRIIPATPSLVAATPGRGSTMSVPVVAAGQIEGFVIVQRRADAPELGPRDLEALAQLARGVGEILPRVRARVGRSVSVLRERDLEQARETQRQFLPKLQPTNSAGVRVLAEYLPALAVGGDFYEFVDLGSGRVLAAIGDVSGKGVNAALM